MLDAIGKETAIRKTCQRIGQCRVDEPLVDCRILEGNGDVVGEELDLLEIFIVELHGNPGIALARSPSSGRIAHPAC